MSTPEARPGPDRVYWVVCDRPRRPHRVLRTSWDMGEGRVDHGICTERVLDSICGHRVTVLATYVREEEGLLQAVTT